MGAVVMKEKSTGLVDKGYPVVEATLYMYCDDCGSFNIKTYTPFVKLIIAVLIPLAPMFLVQNVKERVGCLFMLSFLAIFLPWRDIMLRYKCRKCGNTRIAHNNSLHYQPYDMSVVDIPESLTQKRYIDTDVLHFQQFT